MAMDNEQDELQDIEPSSIITPDDWENQLRDWEQMLIDEEIARLEDEKAERDNNGNMEGDLLNVNAQSTFCDKDTNFCFKIELPSNSAAKNGSSTNNYATFTLTAPSTIGWTAIGIGESMNGAYMMIAWPNSDGTITISQRKSTSYYPESTKNQDDLILHPSSNIKNGQMTAVIQRALSVQGSTLTTSSAGQSFIWAVSNINPKSKTENADLEKHNSKGQEKIVLQKATANNNNNNNNGGTIITLASKSGLTKTQKLVIAHGSFMFLAWMVAVPSAIFIARFGRVTFASSWFHLHWGIQVGRPCTIHISSISNRTWFQNLWRFDWYIYRIFHLHRYRSVGIFRGINSFDA
ncbi:hypothetical protein G9A89_014005 [Geosiphon pyriformis]|nr:hypothetical protein G9A89_014005 [Geosiphon pyriformis]